MNKRQFRRAYVRAKIVLLYGHQSQEQDFTPLEALAGKFFYQMCRAYDPLGARLGGFTDTARSRITLYPLRKS